MIDVDPIQVGTTSRREAIVRGLEDAPERLWYRFEDTDDPPAVGTHGHLAVALLPAAMHVGHALRIHGRVSAGLLANLEEYQDAWSHWRPDLFRRVDFDADEVFEAEQDVEQRSGAVATFSGGVDSTYLVAAHRGRLLGRRSQDLKRAVFVRGFDIRVAAGDAWAKARQAASAVLGAYDVTLDLVSTNWREFAPDWEMTHGAGIASVLHLYDADASMGLIAADESYGFEIVPWGSNSVTNHLLGSPHFPIGSTGTGAGRIEKCKVIGACAAVREHVRVCWEGPETGQNCCVCEKCVRTKLDFAAAGFQSIPALGPITVDQIASIKISNQVQVAYLQEIDQSGALEEPMRHALRKVLRRERARLAARQVRTTVRRQLRRRIVRFLGNSHRDSGKGP